ncbi:MAG TPA: hypothetical protein GYA10_08120 [Alphaproteobacteria bacterium]|nr:hypothetical protein [Alphaproteobacteria bacterium]
MTPRQAALGAALSLLAAAPALAQNDFCYVPGRSGVVDVEATNTWRQLVARQDPQLIAALAGVWYGEIAAPQLGMTSYQYRQFDANGLFQYQDKTCTDGSPLCSSNQGAGFFTAAANGDGSILLFLIVSDLNRDHECAGSYARFVDANTMQDAGGTLWRRVQ